LVEWLESERAFYAQLTAELENKVLTIPDDRIEDLVVTETAHEKYDRSEAQPTWKEIDNELDELPTALCNRGNDLMIEWVYVIDLDNELFSVNNWIFFDLSNIPRNRWIQAFENDDEGRSVFSFEICPEGSVGIEPPGYFAEDATGKSDKYRTTYQEYRHLTVEAIGDINILSQATLQQIVTDSGLEVSR
jgi:hypothetical protein